VGRPYRHTTPEMMARVVAAVEDRLAIAFGVSQMWPNDAQAGRPNGRRGRDNAMTCGNRWWA
jgi:hypothetical protein